MFRFKDLLAKIKVGGNILLSFKVQKCCVVFDGVCPIGVVIRIIINIGKNVLSKIIKGITIRDCAL